MASSNSTLTQLWVEDGQGSPMKTILATPTKTNSVELKEDLIRFCKETGLDPMAKEAGLLELDTGSQTKTIQMVAVPLSSSQLKTPIKVEPSLLPKDSGSPMIIGTPHRVVSSAQLIPNSPAQTAHVIATPVIESPGWTGSRKRTTDLLDPMSLDLSDSKRSKKSEKGGKGLRHFSMKVCEKVQKKGVTSYNEVADELVNEFSDPRNMSPSDQVRSQAYDQKNIRRRVYDALNVLMAMNIISKEKKEIRWIGLPTNSAQECQNLELEKKKRLDRIQQKTQQLQELVLQQIAFKNLVERNKSLEAAQGPPQSNSAIQLPFIIVNTSKKTVIDCSISNDKYEYLFNFDNTFEIHDDIEVLKRMGMAFGLEKGQCGLPEVQKAVKMVPPSLEPYVYKLANLPAPSTSITAGPSGVQLHDARTGSIRQVAAQSLLTPTLPGHMIEQTMDMEVAMATEHGLSRQSSIGSFSDAGPSRGTPMENFSDGSDSERSSPVDVS